MVDEKKTVDMSEKEQEQRGKSSKQPSVFNVFTNGIFKENALIVLLIGLCSALAVSARVEGAFFMGIAATFVLVMSNIIISLIKGFTPDNIRIPIFIVVIASFVTVVDLTMKAFVPSAYALLGVWIPLIVVNCMILGRAEAFAYNNNVFRSAVDGLGMGIGYMVVLVIMALIRETIGSGKIVFLGKTIFAMPQAYQAEPALFFILFPGAFLVFGLLIGLHNIIGKKLGHKESL